MALRQLASELYRRLRQISGLRTWANSPWVRPLRNLLAAEWTARWDREALAYRRWWTARLEARQREYPFQPQPGLLSFFTPVWNTPVPFLHALRQSLAAQVGDQDFEWVVLDNGSTSLATQRYVRTAIAQLPWARVFRVDQNLGIAGGMRFCLEQARHRYVLPVDHDDVLAPDCAAIVAYYLHRHRYPAALYSDEDHLRHGHPMLPFFKPAWDPVLLLNCGYTAHLQVLDRERALAVGAYTDAAVDGSADWDAMLRLAGDGVIPVHVPEILYHWREHAASTARDVSSKPYVQNSQRTALQGCLERRGLADRFDIELSPLFPQTPDWRWRRKHVAPRPLLTAILSESLPASCSSPHVAAADYGPQRVVNLLADAPPESLLALAHGRLEPGTLVCLLGDDVEIESPEWAWEALGLFELHADVVGVTGRLFNDRQQIVEAGRTFGFGGGIDCADAGRSTADPGYFVRLWKTHTTGAPSSQFCILDAAFLRDVLKSYRDTRLTLRTLGAWVGAHARRRNRRIAYTPFITARTPSSWNERVSQACRGEFNERFRDLLANDPFYPSCFGLDPATAYRFVTPLDRARHVQRLLRDQRRRAA